MYSKQKMRKKKIIHLGYNPDADSMYAIQKVEFGLERSI